MDCFASYSQPLRLLTRPRVRAQHALDPQEPAPAAQKPHAQRLPKLQILEVTLASELEAHAGLRDPYALLNCMPSYFEAGAWS